MNAMKRTMAALGVALVCAACANDAPLELPVPMEQASPFQYPESLWDEGVEGQAVVMVLVGSEGTVDSVYVRQTSGWAAMDSAAVRGARVLRFEPGRRGADAVDVWVRLPVRFSKTPPAAGVSDALEAGSDNGSTN
jgi:TonB family protein